jgi:hypothetical protein
MAVLKVPVDFGHSVDFRGRHETPRKCYRIFVRGRIRGCKIQCPAGRRGRGDPSGASAPRRIPLPPAESEVPRDRQRPPVTAVIIQRSFP